MIANNSLVVAVSGSVLLSIYVKQLHRWLLIRIPRSSRLSAWRGPAKPRTVQLSKTETINVTTRLSPSSTFALSA